MRVWSVWVCRYVSNVECKCVTCEGEMSVWCVRVCTVQGVAGHDTGVD